MRAIAMIPARLGATRFPEKLLANIKGKTVIRRTLESTLNTGLFDEVIVVTDSEQIKQEVEQYGGQAVMSKGQYESGTDRIAEIAEDIDADIFVNVQGDEPFVQKAPLEKLLKVFADETGKNIQVASIVQKLKDEELAHDPNFVKVALDLRQNAMYFSRSAIPYLRNRDLGITYYEHIGVYAFRKQALLNFTKWPQSPLEMAEKIECLRFLENGVPIKMVISSYMGVEIDMPEDIQRAEAFMEKAGLE
ncbi:MAG: 3-deoxy-manno-octulosonate cytidylyltransferase [Sphingobacteriales bacterium]|nr:MAG: 3-deoxy-manno-octulosonate cytidylyltransferase [Sphingobacteriales bacterium]